jgi:uncharacterized integral membrane protein (TIGR00698 family)
MNAVLALFDRRREFGQFLPGLAVVSALAFLALVLRMLPGLSMLSPLILAVLAGMTLGHVYRLPARCQAGIGFAGRHILRFAIVLLGLQLSAVQILAIGLDGVVIIVCVVAITFIAIVRLGALLGVDARLTSLLAAGTSICGASAVAAMSTVNKASEEDVTYAMAVVTLLGTVLMLVLPAAGRLLGLDERAFGLWAGVSIHEVAQVTGAAFQFGDAAGETGIIVKLTRVVMLAPLVLACGLWLRQRGSAGADDAATPAIPLFVLGFIAAAALNTLVPIAADTRASLMTLTTFLMSMALAALGLQTSISRLRAKGMRPLVLGAIGAGLIAALGLGLIVIANGLA